MKNLNLPGTFLVLLVIIFSSCGGNKSGKEQAQKTPRIKKYSKLITPKINQEYVLGDEVLFQVSSEKKIDSILIQYEDESTTYSELAFSWKATRGKTGTQQLKLFVYSNGIKENHFPRVKFFSNIHPKEFTYELIKTYSHDPKAFTQGLFFIGDTLVESTGGHGTSTLSKRKLNSLKPIKSVSLENRYFGEGSTAWKDQIIQLSWTSQTGFVYDRTLKKLRTFNYPHEGWGITTFGDTLIVSDGTEMLHLIDPRDFSEIGKLEVYTDKFAVKNLNELEMINGLLYANVWLEDFIVSIDPRSGKVLSKINMAGLRQEVDSDEIEAFNGIAYKPDTDQIFVTGKLWPKLFEVKFVPILN